MIAASILAKNYSIVELKQMRKKLSKDFKGNMNANVRSTINDINEALKIKQPVSTLWVTRGDIKKIIEVAVKSSKKCNICGESVKCCTCVDETVNPWAVCTASTGNKTGKKREKCIKKVKDES